RPARSGELWKLTMNDCLSRPRLKRVIVLAVCTVAAMTPLGANVSAQGWGGWWPWSQSEPRPVPREPVYRPPPDQLPPGQPAPGQLPAQPPAQGPQGQAQGQGFGQRSNICVQLERRLVAETQGGNQGRDLLPRIENDMRQIQRNFEAAQQ